MGFLNFLKKKEEPNESDVNSLFLQSLKSRIEEQGHSVEYSTDYAAIIVDSQIEIASKIADGEFHPSLLPMMILVLNETFFPKGINANLAGFGDTPEDKVESATNGFMSNFFSPIIENFSDSHRPEFDFKSEASGKEILWHPKMSDNLLQGTWQETSKETNLYSIVEQEVQHILADNKFNWLKLYISRQPNGEISGECLLNNEFWEEGYSLLCQYASTWKDQSKFLAHKQFIVFRRCDECD